MLRFLKNKQGFTLIELVIIIILLGMLAAIAIPRYVDLRDQALRAAAQATLDSGRAGVSLDFADQILNKGTYNNALTDGSAENNPLQCCAAGNDVNSLEATLASSPNYPPAGTYNNPPTSPGRGFEWYLVTQGKSTSPYQPPVIDGAIDTTCGAGLHFGGTDNQRCKASML